MQFCIQIIAARTTEEERFTSRFTLLVNTEAKPDDDANGCFDSIEAIILLAERP